MSDIVTRSVFVAQVILATSFGIVSAMCLKNYTGTWTGKEGGSKQPISNFSGDVHLSWHIFLAIRIEILKNPNVSIRIFQQFCAKRTIARRVFFHFLRLNLN